MIDVCEGNIVRDIEDPLMNAIEVQSLIVPEFSISKEEVVIAEVSFVVCCVIASVILSSGHDTELFVGYFSHE